MKYFHQDKIEHLPIFVEMVANYETIKKEILGFCKLDFSLVDYPTYPVGAYDSLYQNYWKAAPVSRFKNEFVEYNSETAKRLSILTENTKTHCPTLVKIIADWEQQGHLVNSFISRLVPGSIINPHTGWVKDYLRVHFCIVADPNCKITVGNETSTWEAGKLLAFNDGDMHSVRHDGVQQRIVWSVDIDIKYLKLLGINLF
jgi:aspartyl/asparaginyl beta-hydroxylase (cupin superfamily)